MSDPKHIDKKVQSALTKERFGLLRKVDHVLEGPMLFLAFVWLVLLIVELTKGLTPSLELAGTLIWMAFILEFLIKFTLAPKKLSYLKHNWLTVISLLVPALRVLRFARVLRLMRLSRAARGIRLVKVVGSLNRGMRSLARTMRRRGLKYVLLTTTIVILGGAAGMQAFESEHGLHSYVDALWWTIMIMTTIGSDLWPQTGEGRILCLLLSIYAITVFGYITASLASVFIHHDQREDQTQQLAQLEMKLNSVIQLLSPPAPSEEEESRA